MLKNASRKLALALTLTVLTAAAGKAIAQSTTPPPPPPPPTSSTPPPASPGIVTGTDPGPDVVGMILAFFHLA
jgi:hypothetical protein